MSDFGAIITLLLVDDHLPICISIRRPPAALYTLTKTLARYLEVPLTLNARTAPTVANVRERKAKSDPAQHRKDNVPPEVALVTTVTIALKIVYGLNGSPVYVLLHLADLSACSRLGGAFSW